MGVLLDENTRVVIQGFGGAGQREAKNCMDYGTKIVAGVTPGRGGQVIENVPIRNTVKQAVQEFQANVSLIFVPAPFAADAIIENARYRRVACFRVPMMDNVVMWVEDVTR